MTQALISEIFGNVWMIFIMFIMINIRTCDLDEGRFTMVDLDPRR